MVQQAEENNLGSILDQISEIEDINSSGLLRKSQYGKATSSGGRVGQFPDPEYMSRKSERTASGVVEKRKMQIEI